MSTTEGNGIVIEEVGKQNPNPLIDTAKEKELESKENDPNPDQESEKDKENLEKSKEKEKNAEEENKNKSAEEIQKEKETENQSSKSEKDKEDSSEFSVNFKKEEAPKPKEKEKKQESASISEEKVLEFLKTKNPSFKDIESLSDISTKVELSEPVQKFQEYHNKTGRGIEDFYNLHRNWKEESEDKAIVEFLKLSEKNISNEDIELQMDLLRVPTEENEDEFTDSEIKQRKINWNKTHREAIAFLNKMQKDLQTPLTNQNQSVKQRKLTDDEFNKMYQPYWDKRDNSLNEFNEFSFTTSLGDISVKINEADKKAIKELTQTPETFFNLWKDGEKGINTNQTVQDVAWMIPSIKQRMITEISAQVNTLTLENLSKKQRNVKLEKIKDKASPESSVKVEVVNDSNPSTFGEPLIKKRS